MDLNLVRVFVTVYEAQNLTVAAERLFVTQSAVSQAVGRLRDHLDDRLFERVGRVLVPTPLADAVFPSFRGALREIDRTLDAVHGFEAQSSERVFRIALSELGEIGWLAAIVEALRTAAPAARLEVVQLETELLPELLSRGSVDLAITPAELAPEYPRTMIKRQRYGVAMSASNPLASGPFGLVEYRSAHRISVASDAVEHLIAVWHERVGGVADPAVSVQHFAALLPVLARSKDLVATIPDTIAEGWAADWPIVVRKLPFEMPPIEIRLYSRNSTQHAGALEWFYRLVGRTIAGSVGEFASIRVPD